VFLPGWDDISTLHDLIMADQMFKSGRLYINIYSLKLKQFLFTKGPSYYGFHIQVIQKVFHILLQPYSKMD